jgi:8-oxo-dGTP pyrophosphatase MutT (NUDIX family)
MSNMYKAGGIIIKGRKLLVERSVGKEFFIAPGGQIENDETAAQALVRELKEEFQINVDEDSLEPFGDFSADAAGRAGVTVHMQIFLVKKWSGEIKPDNEVEEIHWLTSDNPENLPIGSIFEHEVVPRLKKKDLID